MDNAKLSREAIINEAIALLNEEGINGLSMRRLAARLDIQAPTLYWYFKDKGALISGVMDTLFSICLDAAPASDTWQDWMRGFGRAVWQLLNDYPQASVLVMSANVDEKVFESITTRIMQAVAGYDPARFDLMRLQSAVQSLMMGWSTFSHAKYADRLSDIFIVEQAAFDSLDALIAGWVAQMAKPN